MTPKQLSVIDRITEYLSGGGLFNPELANHDAVRDLLIDAREAHAAALEELARLKAAVELLYDKWENGDDCHEISGDEMGAFLGKAFQLSKDEEDAILALINGIPTPSPMQIVMQRAEQAERRAERLRFHAEAMAKDLELSYEVGESSLAAYQAEFKEE